jgi:hypothetical protein
MYGYGFKYRGGGNGSLGYSNTKSLLLDGVDEYVNADSLISSLSSTTVGTWSFWFKTPDSTPAGSNFIISFGDTNADNRLNCYMSTGGKIGIVHRKVPAVDINLVTDAKVINDNTWYHVAITQDGTTGCTIYINGSAPAQTESGTNPTYWFNNFGGLLDNGRIGDINWNSSGESLWTNGNIDDVAIFNTNLSSGDISDIYNGGCPKDESSRSGLVSYYKFGNGAGDNWNSGVANEWQFIDQKGSNNISTVNCEESDVEADTPC